MAVNLIDSTDISVQQTGSDIQLDFNNNSFNNKVIANNSYSTTETKIGTWIDGKPLYRKTLEITIATSGDYTTNLVSNNIKNITSYKGYCYVANQTTIFRPFPYITWNTNISKTQGCWVESFEAGYLVCRTTWNNSKIFLTIEYTKTTD